MISQLDTIFKIFLRWQSTIRPYIENAISRLYTGAGTIGHTFK